MSNRNLPAPARLVPVNPPAIQAPQPPHYAVAQYAPPPPPPIPAEPAATHHHHYYIAQPQQQTQPDRPRPAPRQAPPSEALNQIATLLAVIVCILFFIATWVGAHAAMRYPLVSIGFLIGAAFLLVCFIALTSVSGGGSHGRR